MSWFKEVIDASMYCAAENGGATNFDEAMEIAVRGGHVEIVKLCKEWGATDFDFAMEIAARGGYVEMVKLCKEWGATNFDFAMRVAVFRGHVEIVNLCRDWLGYGKIHEELLKYHHKLKYFKKIYEEMLPIAWHPDRWWDWCVDEEEKEIMEEMWKC